MQINIIITKKYRDEYLNTCLFYLKKAGINHNINVYIAEEGYSKFHQLSEENFKIFQFYTEERKIFSKSKLLNLALKEMREDFDIITFVDVDMIYKPDFFDKIENLIKQGYNYITCQGSKLKENSLYEIINKLPTIENINKYEAIKFNVSPSQITMNKECYNLFLALFGDKLYDEFYEGWGCEDSDLSFKSRIMNEKKLIKKINIDNMWYHLWHEDTNRNPQLYNINKKHFDLQWVKNEKFLRSINANNISSIININTDIKK